MDAETGLKLKTATDIEGEFLLALEESPLPVERMLGMLTDLEEDGDTLAEMLQSALLESEAGDDLLKVFAVRASWRPEDVVFGEDVLTSVRKVYKDRNSRALIDCAGLGKVGCGDAVRQLTVLLSLKPGLLVLPWLSVRWHFISGEYRKS